MCDRSLHTLLLFRGAFHRSDSPAPHRTQHTGSDTSPAVLPTTTPIKPESCRRAEEKEEEAASCPSWSHWPPPRAPRMPSCCLPPPRPCHRSSGRSRGSSAAWWQVRFGFRLFLYAFDWKWRHGVCARVGARDRRDEEQHSSSSSTGPPQTKSQHNTTQTPQRCEPPPPPAAAPACYRPLRTRLSAVLSPRQREDRELEEQEAQRAFAGIAASFAEKVVEVGRCAGAWMIGKQAFDRGMAPVESARLTRPLPDPPRHKSTEGGRRPHHRGGGGLAAPAPREARAPRQRGGGRAGEKKKKDKKEMGACVWMCMCAVLVKLIGTLTCRANPSTQRH